LSDTARGTVRDGGRAGHPCQVATIAAAWWRWCPLIRTAVPGSYAGAVRPGSQGGVPRCSRPRLICWG